jgi:hypothetical protein
MSCGSVAQLKSDAVQPQWLFVVVGLFAALIGSATVESVAAQETSRVASERPLFGIAIRNAALEQRFRRTRNEQKPVAKSLMNSNVTGTQSTVTETRMRIVPDSKSLRFEVLNSGDVVSQTTGFNPQATVDSLGNHHFEVTKPMWFDGSKFLTLPAHGTIQASQTPQRVMSTAGASMPLLGPLTDRVAWNEVLRRTPQINQAVAEDVSRDVLPEIDRIVDADFAALQSQWRTLQEQVKATFPANRVQWAARSGTRTFAVWAQPELGARSAASLPAVPDEARGLTDAEEVVVFVSEDAVGSLVSRYFPGGLKLTDTQLQKIQQARAASTESSPFSFAQVVQLLNDLRSVEASPASLFTLEFAKERPLEIRFVDGDIRVNTTFQIHPAAGASSGWMTTSFNLRGKRLSQNEWTMAIRSVDVGESAQLTSVDPDDDFSLPSDEPLYIPGSNQLDQTEEIPANDVTTVQAGTVWMPIIRNAAESLAEKIPPVKLPLEFDGTALVPESPRFRLGKIDAAGGMLRVALRIVDTPPMISAP